MQGTAVSRVSVVTSLLALMLWLAVAGSAWGQKSCHPDGKPIENEVVFNSSGGSYGEAIEKVFFRNFEKDCGAKVTHVTDARTYAQMRQYVRSGSVPWDLGGTRADQEMPLGIKDGILHKLPAGFWDTLKADMIPGSFNDYGAWATPYSDILVYSTTAVPNGMKNWKDFWDVKTFPGPRMMQNNPISLVMALLADGVPADKVYPLDLDRAFRKMDELRPNIRAFWTAADVPVLGVANGEFTAATTWNGRLVSALRAGRPVAPAWDGALLHTSWTFILKDSPHPRAAEALLYYMQRPELQAELAKLTGYTGGNKKVAALLEPGVVANLASSPEHAAMASVIDAQWWADNLAPVQARWDAWMAKR